MPAARIRVSRNATRYSGRELRTLLCLVHRSVAQVRGRRIQPWAHVAISVAYARGDGPRWTNGTTLALPRGEVLRADLVRVMERWVAWKMGRSYAYAAGATPQQHGSLYEKPEPPKLPPEARRYQRVLEAERRWVKKLAALERGAKRAARELAKIAKQKRYYQTTLLAPVSGTNERRTDDDAKDGGADQREDGEPRA